MLLRVVEIFIDGRKNLSTICYRYYKGSSMILHKLSSLNLSFLTCKMGIMHIMLTLIKNKNICNMLDLY